MRTSFVALAALLPLATWLGCSESTDCRLTATCPLADEPDAGETLDGDASESDDGDPRDESGGPTDEAESPRSPDPEEGTPTGGDAEQDPAQRGAGHEDSETTEAGAPDPKPTSELPQLLPELPRDMATPVDDIAQGDSGAMLDRGLGELGSESDSGVNTEVQVDSSPAVDPCTACFAPLNAMPTCEATCGWICNDNYKACDGACIPDAACCSDRDCVGERACSEGACACEPGLVSCAESCIPEQACCTDDDCDTGVGCDAGECVDSVPPQIVGMVPREGEGGVPSDARVIITFSESMDTGSVASALAVSSVPLDDLVLDWNSTGTRLTITPEVDFVYASGASPSSTNARSYSVGIASVATDLSGNELTLPFTSSFTTLRRITASLAPTGVAEYTPYSVTQGDGIQVCPTGTENVRVGWWVAQGSGGTWYAYVAYDARSLAAADSTVEVESAVFGTVQGAADPLFYPDGWVQLDKLEYGPLNDGVFDLDVTTSFGVLSDSASPEPEMNITTSFWLDWSGGAPQQLFRLSYAGEPDSGDYARFTCSGFALEVTYLIP